MNRTTQVDRNSVYSICRHTSSSCIVEIHAALQRHLAAKRNYSVWLDLDLCRHVGRQHLGQLVVLQAALEELLLRQVPVLVLVHPVEDVLGALLGGVGGLDGAGAQHVVDGLHDLGHLLQVDHTVTIHIVHPESPFELLLGGAGRGHVDGEQELLEVDVSVLVGVERAEHVVAELLRVATGEE